MKEDEITWIEGGKMKTSRCNVCGKENQIVNQCGCDPNNLPTRITKKSWDHFSESDKMIIDKLVDEFFTRAGERGISLKFLTDAQIAKYINKLRTTFASLLKASKSAKKVEG